MTNEKDQGAGLAADVNDTGPSTTEAASVCVMHAGVLARCLRCQEKRDQVAAAPVPVCRWGLNDECYATDCGHGFVLTTLDSLAAHGFRFCVYCGRPIEENDLFGKAS